MRAREHKRSARKRPAPRRLMLKFRVRPLVRMPKSVMFAKLQETLRSGVAPDDLEISYMAWDHSRGQKFEAGDRISGDDLEEMRKFYDVLLAVQDSKVRFEKAD